MMSHETLTIDAYMRAYSPTSRPQNEVAQRLARLNEAGRIDDYDVEVVPEAVSLDGEPTAVERRYDAFLAWADRAGAVVDEAFTVRRTENEITGDVRTRLLTPIVSLAVRADGELVGVLPCRIDGEHVSVNDFLDAFERGADPLGTLPASGPADGPSSTTPRTDS